MWSQRGCCHPISPLKGAASRAQRGACCLDAAASLPIPPPVSSQPGGTGAAREASELTHMPEAQRCGSTAVIAEHVLVPQTHLGESSVGLPREEMRESRQLGKQSRFQTFPSARRHLFGRVLFPLDDPAHVCLEAPASQLLTRGTGSLTCPQGQGHQRWGWAVPLPGSGTWVENPVPVFRITCFPSLLRLAGAAACTVRRWRGCATAGSGCVH